MKRIILVCLALAFGLSGCGTTAVDLQKENRKLLSKSVYATDDSIGARRYDLAKGFSAQSVRLIEPPDAKERIKINGVTTGGSTKKAPAKKKTGSSSTVFTLPPDDNGGIVIDQPVVVLPESDKDAKVIVENTPEYKALEEKNAAFKSDNDRLKNEKVIMAANTDRYLKKQANYIADQAEKELKGHWYDGIFHVFGWFSLAGLLIGGGLLALFIFNPILFTTVIGVIFKLFKVVGIVLTKVFGALGVFLTLILAKISAKPVVAPPTTTPPIAPPEPPPSPPVPPTK